MRTQGLQESAFLHISREMQQIEEVKRQVKGLSRRRIQQSLSAIRVSLLGRDEMQWSRQGCDFDTRGVPLEKVGDWGSNRGLAEKFLLLEVISVGTPTGYLIRSSYRPGIWLHYLHIPNISCICRSRAISYADRQ